MNKKQVIKLFGIVLTGALCFLFYHNTIFFFPSYIHAWTQSDRYALALCFLDNGLDFFHPCTFNLQTIDGITRVDFPINEYLIAILMKMTGNNSPFIFRLFMLLYSLTGLYFLARLACKISGSVLTGLFISIFVFLSPVYLYYQNGFLPSVTALANIFIGCYFFYSYKQKNLERYLFLSSLFFMIAALERMPFVIALVAFSFCILMDWLDKKRIHKKEFMAVLIPVVIFTLYNLYNVHLGKKYGAMFLTTFRNAHSVSEMNQVNQLVYKNWFYEYFSGFHWTIILICTVLLLFFRKKNSFTEIGTIRLFTGVYAVLGLVYFFFMQFQFIDHDYYFLDSLFVPLVFIVLITSANKLIHSKTGLALLSVFIIGCIYSGFNSYSKRYENVPWDRYEITLKSFDRGKQILDSLDIPADAKILVPDAYSTNAPLILLGRKGYTVQTTSENNLKKAMQLPYDYIAAQNMFLVSDVLNNYPSLMMETELVFDNKNFSLFKKHRYPSGEISRLDNFLQIDKTTAFHFLENFDDSLPSPSFSNIKRSEKRRLSGSYSSVLDSETQYGFNFDFPSDTQKVALQNCRLLFKGNFYFENELNNLYLVLSVDGAKGNIYYQNFRIPDYIHKVKEWQYIELQFAMIPLSGNNKLKCFLSNPDKGEVYCDDIDITVY